MACRHKTLYYRAGGHICCGRSHNTLYLLGWRHICCGLQTQDFVLKGWRTYLLWPQPQYLVPTGLEDICVVACRHKTLYYRDGGHICCDRSHNTLSLLVWGTYLWWPADTIHCININIYLHCADSSIG